MALSGEGVGCGWPGGEEEFEGRRMMVSKLLTPSYLEAKTLQCDSAGDARTYRNVSFIILVGNELDNKWTNVQHKSPPHSLWSVG